MDNPPKRKPTVTKPGSSFRPRVQTQPNRPQPHSQPQPHHRFQSQPNRPQLQPQSQPQTRPRVQSQTNRPQGVYRPQMYDSSSPLMDYNQPIPPLPEGFNPFSDTRTNHPHTVENEGMGDDWFEQVHTVPETPMYNVEEVEAEEEQVGAEEEQVVVEVEELGAEEEQVVVEVESRPKKAEKRKWESEEEEALAKSWIKISTDKLVGDRQTKEGFWKRVLKHYQSLIPGSNRTKDQVNSKWTLMNAAMVAFNGYYSQAVRIKQSGCNDLQVFERALADYEKHYRKPFTHHKAWHVVKTQPKWLEQPVVGQEPEETSKKRKSSDSSNAPTPRSVNDIDCELPNLNDNPTPSRQSRGKKKKSVETSSSTRDSVEVYTAEKTILLKARVEAQRKKDEKYLKFIEAEEYNRDMKFVMDPHEHIQDPAFKEFIIKRKREFCAKYGWPCTL